MPGSASRIGLVHGDVQSGEPDYVPGGGEPAGVTDLGEDRDRGQLTDAESAHQHLAARLAARERTQFRVQRPELARRARRSRSARR